MKHVLVCALASGVVASSVLAQTEHAADDHHGDPSSHEGSHGRHSPAATAELLERLRDGGHVLFVRHERTDMMVQDQPDRVIEDCSTQRNLSIAGIASAKEIGENLRFLDVPVGTVLASPMCRTLETARHMFGRAIAADALLGSGREGEIIGEDVRRLAVEHGGGAANAVLVAHISNIEYAFDGHLHEGDTAIIAVENGQPTVVGTVPANGWNDLVIDNLHAGEGHAHEGTPAQ